MGLSKAGWEVTGVDIRPQPNYPFRFIQADATTFDIKGYDLVWASPPCQRFSVATREKEKHPDLIPPIRELLRAAPLSIIENVPQAPLRKPIILCGAAFGLGVIRHRAFECSFHVDQPVHKPHGGSIATGEFVTVTGNGGVPTGTLKMRERMGLPRYIPGETSLSTWSYAMRIDWMTREELVQAIPPAYSAWLGQWAAHHHTKPRVCV